MVTAYDSITLADIPRDAAMILYYANGSWAANSSDLALFPNAHQESISVTPFANVGDWLDVETGDAFPWQAPDWIAMRRAAGHPNPGVYVQDSMWAATRSEFYHRGIPEPRWWIALWDGVASVPPGAFGKQYAANYPGTPYNSGGHFDKSVFLYTFGAASSTLGGIDLAVADDILAAVTVKVPLGPVPARLAAYTAAELDQVVATATWDGIETVYGKESRDWLYLRAHPQTVGAIKLINDLTTQVAGLTAKVSGLSAPSVTVDLGPVITLLNEIKAHPSVVSDPALLAALAKLSVHLGVGTP